MKLSEAILLGSTLSGQAFGVNEDADGRTCARGAAVKAMGGNTGDYCGLLTLFPFVHDDSACPVENCYFNCGAHPMIFSVIGHLNDTHEWTREQIAEWVATVEPPSPPSQEETPAELEMVGRVS